jgi:hypothetical protein
MASVALILLFVLLAWYVGSLLRRRGHGVVAKRGISIGADLGTMADMPRVQIREVIRKDPDRLRIVLAPEPADEGDVQLELVVYLREDETGTDLLREWKRSETVLAMVRPPDSRIVRLRSFDDLQPLTLRVADD